MLNEMLDLVESGLEQGQNREGKSNFLMVELTLTTSIQKTATSTRTTTASCVAGTFTECSRVSEGLQEARNLKHPRDAFPEAIVTTSSGATVDISEILPSRVESPRARSGDIEHAFLQDLEVDGILGRTLSAGSLSWSELEMVSAPKSCGRSDSPRRPRFVQVASQTVSTELTSTMTETLADTRTVTFNVEGISCTAAGFSFGVAMCPPAATTTATATATAAGGF